MRASGTFWRVPPGASPWMGDGRDFVSFRGNMGDRNDVDICEERAFCWKLRVGWRCIEAFAPCR